MMIRSMIRSVPLNLFALNDAIGEHRRRLRNGLAAMAGRPAKEINSERLDHTVLGQAMDAYDNIAGRFDSPQRVPSRYLERVAPADEAELKKRGVVRDEQGRWVVPEDQDLDAYERWWPMVPEDLLDKTPRLITTKNGKSIHAYVLPEDRGQGADSTATVLMYAAFPVISAFVFAVGQAIGPLAYVFLLLLTPYVVSLTQSEGPKEAIKALVILGLGPLFMTNWGGAGVVGSIMDGMVSGSATSMAISWASAVGLLVLLAFVSSVVFDDESKGAFRGSFETFKGLVKWGVFIGIAYGLTKVLPDVVEPVFWFGLACLWPMKYTNDNAVIRAGLLYAHAMESNLETQGALTNVAVAPKFEQAKRAQADTTPLFTYGTATGWLTRKHYDWAPDEGTPMRSSSHDLGTHMLIFGDTGSGKTESMMRGTAVQWVASNAGGFYCVDGKGSLPGELKSLFDIRVRTGIDFAPMEGLDGHGVYLALTGLTGGHTMKAEDRIWVDGANDVIDHITQLHWALHTHEHAYRAFAPKMVRLKELKVDELELEVCRLEKLGQDTSAAHDELTLARKHLAEWRHVSDGQRKWLWNVHTLVKVLSMVDAVVESAGGARPSDELIAAADFLGYAAEPQRMETMPQTVHPEIGKQSILDGSLDFLMNHWPNTDQRQRSSFMINVRQRLLPLTRGPHLVNAQGVHWSQLEHGVDVGACLYGKKVGLDLPETTHGDAGLAIAAFANQRVYSGLKARAAKGDRWTEDGSTPVLFMFDEAQLLVGEQETKLLPIARSLGGRFIMATQGFESLEVQFGSKIAATKFANTFQSPGCMKASLQTYEYMMERLGTAQLVSFKQPTVGLDVGAAVEKFALSPLNDVDHPDRPIMAKFRSKGAGMMRVLSGNRGAYAGGAAKSRQFIGHAAYAIDEGEIAKRIIVPHGGVKEIQPVIKLEEFQALCTMGQGVLLLNRAGARRVDVVRWHPVKASEVETRLAELRAEHAAKGAKRAPVMAAA